jgi:hypothetical protein
MRRRKIPVEQQRILTMMMMMKVVARRGNGTGIGAVVAIGITDRRQSMLQRSDGTVLRVGRAAVGPVPWMHWREIRRSRVPLATPRWESGYPDHRKPVIQHALIATLAYARDRYAIRMLDTSVVLAVKGRPNSGNLIYTMVAAVMAARMS